MLDFTFYIGSTSTFIYFDLYLNTASLIYQTVRCRRYAPSTSPSDWLHRISYSMTYSVWQIRGKVLVFEKYGMRCDWLLQYKGESVMEHGILWSQSDWLNRILNLAESSDNQKWKNYFPRDDDSFLHNFSCIPLLSNQHGFCAIWENTHS